MPRPGPYRYGRAEPVASRGVGGDELGELVAGGDVEKVGRAGFAAPVVVKRCPDQGRVADDRYGCAEPVADRSVGGGELGELVAGGDVEKVGRAGAVASVVILPCSDQGCVAADRYGTAERVACRSVGGGELGELVAGGDAEQVRRAGVAAPVVVTRCSDQCRVAADRYGTAKKVPCRGVGGGELGKLVAGGDVEQVRRAGVAASVVVTPCPDQGRVAADCYGIAERFVRRSVGGGELEELVAGGDVEQVRRAGVAAPVVVTRCPRASHLIWWCNDSATTIYCDSIECILVQYQSTAKSQPQNVVLKALHSYLIRCDGPDSLPRPGPCCR